MAESVTNNDLQQPQDTNIEQIVEQPKVEAEEKQLIVDGGGNEQILENSLNGRNIEEQPSEQQVVINEGDQLVVGSSNEENTANNPQSIAENTEETTPEQPSVTSMKPMPRISVSFEDGEPRETSIEELQELQEVPSETVDLTPVPGEIDINQSHRDVTSNDEKVHQPIMSVEEFQSVSSDSVEEFNRDEALENYKMLSTEYEKNLTNHSHLQHKIAEYLAKKKGDEKPDPGKTVADQEQRLQKCMAALDQLQEEAHMDKADFENVEKSLINHCKVKQEEMEKAWKIFKDMVIDKCVGAVHSRTGRRLASHEIEQYLGMLEKKDEEVIQVRLENLKLQSRINKLDTLIQQKEQLAEGLHMIDFEQLRINNVDLNEKIEDRNEEIHKLQKKVTSTVQVLAHLKEKLQFMQSQNHLKEEQLRELDQEVAKNRDTLNGLKHAKDAVRSENIHLKERGGLVFHRALLRDFEEQIDLKESMLAKLREIKEKHSDLTLLCNKLKQKIDQAKAIML